MKPRGSFTFAKIPATFTLAQDRCSGADFPTSASAANFPPNWSDVEALSSLDRASRIPLLAPMGKTPGLSHPANTVTRSGQRRQD